MKRFLATLSVIFLASFATAQEDQNSDDGGYLTNLLESSLSGGGHRVSILGFAGALSSRATIQELSIADNEGRWLLLRDVVLDWNRLALVKGQLDVNALTAAEIELSRLPAAAQTGPSSQARAFSLPDLPVSVDISDLRADRVTFGAPVLGREIQVRLSGAMVLEGGSGQAALSVERTDQAQGNLALDARFDRASGNLLVDLALVEEADGITAELLKLPGRPSVEMTIIGDGPVSDFTADIELATDGQERLAGQVVIAQVSGPETDGVTETVHRIDANISGNIAPLLVPEHQEFFGPLVALSVSGWRNTNGVIQLERLDLESASLNLKGTGAIGESGWPERFSLAGVINDPDGSPVRLPLPGTNSQVQTAHVDLKYDAAKNDNWKGKILVRYFLGNGIAIDTLVLGGDGEILGAEDARVGYANGDFEFLATGIEAQGSVAVQTLGSNVTGTTSFDWTPGEPIKVGDLTVKGEDFGLTANAHFSGLSDNLNIDGQVQIQAQELGRLAPLVGRDLDGSGSVNIKGQYAPLGGAFDLVVDVDSSDLAIGQAHADRLLRGQGKLLAEVSRDTAGTVLRLFDLETPAVAATAAGRIGSGDGELKLNARLANLGVFVPGLEGPVNLGGTATEEGTNWNVEVTGDGPGATKLAITGSVAADATRANINATGTAQLGLVNPFIEPKSLTGDAAFDLTLDGPLDLSSLTGDVRTSNGRMTAPVFGVTATDMEMTARMDQGRANVNLSGNIASGGRFLVTGPVALASPNNGDLSIELQNVHLVDPELYETVVAGRVSVNGALTGGANISGDLRILNTEISVPSSGFYEAGSLPGLVHLNEPRAVRETRARAGLLAAQVGAAGSGSVFPLDITVDAPERLFVRGRGLDAELGGRLHLTGTTANVEPEGSFELIRGRLEILGKRLDLTEGKVEMRGQFVPVIRFMATTPTDAGSIFITIEGEATSPTVTFASQPELPQDEVLAQMLFNRSISEISPIQAAQLAAAVATLAGKGGGGIINKLRENFGLDDLDVTTNEDGSTGVRVGKYISDNIYTDIEIDSEGTSQINLNLQLSPSTVIKGGAGSDGHTGVGVYFEKNY